MGRINTPILDNELKAILESGFKTNTSHAFRMRCHLILLKAEGRSSRDVASIVGMCEMSVNNWVFRFKCEGLAGLLTKKGRGRKPLLSQSADGAAILTAVQSHRQRISTAKALFESQGGTKTSKSTFRTFLKSLVADIDG